MNAKPQHLQDPYLNALRRERVPVALYLVNGIRLQGRIDSFDAHVLLLKSADLFERTSSEHLVPLAQVAEEVYFVPGEHLIRQGEAGDCLYLLVEGSVSIVLQGLGEVARRDTRNVIGEMSVLTRKPRSADCLALTEVIALRIGYDVFWELLAKEPPLALGVIRVLAGRLDEAVGNLQRLGGIGSPGSSRAGAPPQAQEKGRSA